jgi:DUF4097 and DUF4098 domain-containing protein YvlB
MKRFLWVVPALAAAALAQSKPALSRDAGRWTETLSGSVPAASALEVSTLGSIRVQAQDRSGIAYTLRRFAKASSEAAARKLLDQIVFKTSARGGATVLRIEVPDPRRTFADLELLVPRNLRAASLLTAAGPIQASGLAGSVRADTGGGAIDVNDIGGAVDVRTAGGAVVLRRIAGRLECFSAGGAIYAEGLGGAANLNTSGGEIVIRDSKGPVVARSMGGAIRVERASGGVRIASSVGLIDVVDSTGPIVADTAAGSIKVRSVSNVQCNSGAGAIHLQAVSGELRATTRAGSIVANLAGARLLRASELTTSMGDITVFIPSNLAVTVQAIVNEPGGHRIISDFAQIRPRVEPGAAQTSARGALNGGGPLLRLAATGGTIYLRRQQ